MFTIRNSRNGHQSKHDGWVKDEGYNKARVEIRCETPEEASKLERVQTTTREKLMAQAQACNNTRFEAEDVPTWRRVGFKKVAGTQGRPDFWTATFIPGEPMQAAELCL